MAKKFHSLFATMPDPGWAVSFSDQYAHARARHGVLLSVFD